MPAYKYTLQDGKTTKWYANFYYTDWTGTKQHKCKRGFSREKDAKEWERMFLDKYSKTPDILFSSLYEKYLEYCSVVKKLSVTTLDRKKNQFETHILPFFGKRKTNDIEAIDVGNWQASVKMKGYEEFPTIGYKDTYLKSINAELSAIFNFAVKFYKLQQNPCIPAGSMGKSKAAAMKIWTLDQYNQFISYENKEYGKLAFDLFFWCGIREGELLGLSPSRVSDHNLHIEDNFQQTSEGDIINPPKNKKTRDVSVPDFLYRQLTDYIDKLYGIGPNDRIFFFTKSFLQKEIKRVAAMAGLDPIRVHDLRHSHVSLLIEMGYNIFMIADRIGDTIQVTMDTYSHLYPDKGTVIATGLHNVGIDGLSANKTTEEQLLGLLQEIQKTLPSYSDFVGNEIIVWNPVSREKEIIDDEQFKERIAGADNENDAVHAMMHDGFYEFSKTCVFCFADKGMPAKYL